MTAKRKTMRGPAFPIIVFCQGEASPEAHYPLTLTKDTEEEEMGVILKSEKNVADMIKAEQLRKGTLTVPHVTLF